MMKLILLFLLFFISSSSSIAISSSNCRSSLVADVIAVINFQEDTVLLLRLYTSAEIASLSISLFTKIQGKGKAENGGKS